MVVAHAREVLIAEAGEGFEGLDFLNGEDVGVDGLDGRGDGLAVIHRFGACAAGERGAPPTPPIPRGLGLIEEILDVVGGDADGVLAAIGFGDRLGDAVANDALDHDGLGLFIGRCRRGGLDRRRGRGRGGRGLRGAGGGGSGRGLARQGDGRDGGDTEEQGSDKQERSARGCGLVAAARLVFVSATAAAATRSAHG